MLQHGTPMQDSSCSLPCCLLVCQLGGRQSSRGPPTREPLASRVHTCYDVPGQQVPQRLVVHAQQPEQQGQQDSGVHLRDDTAARQSRAIVVMLNLNAASHVPKQSTPTGIRRKKP